MANNPEFVAEWVSKEGWSEKYFKEEVFPKIE
jgi:hypothetical protein